MKTNERDDLLIRLDERSRNTWHTVEKIELQQNEQNGRIRKNTRYIYWILGVMGAGGASAGIAQLF